MQESDFWSALEFRICRELEGLPKGQRQGLWCDGFLPDELEWELHGKPPRVTGSVWMGVGPREQQRWSFRLTLNHPNQDRSEIEWSTLLPPEDQTHWLTVDWDNRYLEIDPKRAAPDEPP